MSGDGFEWDENKRRANLEKHGIAFEQAVGIFDGPVLTLASPRAGETRWLAIGEVSGCVIVVVYTRRGRRFRIISARRAHRNERDEYRKRTRSPGG